MTTAQVSQVPLVVVISGGTGMTAKHVLNAALAQFEDCSPEIVYQSKIRSSRSAVSAIRDAAARHALVCHSIVDPAVRRSLDEEALKLGVPCIDVLGPALSLLADHLKTEPRGHAGLLYELHREQLDRIDAVDFTLAHDDGKRMSELGQADIVLVGASRTSKSVTCFYLAARDSGGERSPHSTTTDSARAEQAITKTCDRADHECRSFRVDSTDEIGSDHTSAGGELCGLEGNPG